jgi:hypothetical protein
MYIYDFSYVWSLGGESLREEEVEKEIRIRTYRTTMSDRLSTQAML